MSHDEVHIYQTIIDRYKRFSNSFSFIENSDLNKLSEFERLWEKLFDSISFYIEWIGWKYENDVPMTLQNSIQSNYIDFLIINASSSLESALKESIIIRLEKEMHGIARIKDLVHFLDDLDKSSSDYYQVQKDILSAVQNVVPLRGANPGIRNLENFIEKSSVARKKKFNNLMKFSNIEQAVLAELVKMRNDIAHQNFRGYINPMHVAYCILASLEVSRIVVFTLLGDRNLNDGSDGFEILFRMEDSAYRDFESDMKRKHGSRPKVSNIFGNSPI